MERLKCLCFSEGAPYLIKDYPEIIDSLDDALISVNNRNASFSWKGTGFSIVRNTPVVVFPKNYTVPITAAAIKEEASNYLHLQTNLNLRLEVKIIFFETANSQYETVI